MTTTELSAVVKGVSDAVKDYIDGALTKLWSRVDAIERREIPTSEGPQGPAGRDGTSVLTGVGQPEIAAKEHDLYLDVETGDIYQWR